MDVDEFQKFNFLQLKGLNFAFGVRSSNGTQRKEIPVVQCLLAHTRCDNLIPGIVAVCRWGVESGKGRQKSLVHR